MVNMVKYGISLRVFNSKFHTSALSCIILYILDNNKAEISELFRIYLTPNICKVQLNLVTK